MRPAPPIDVPVGIRRGTRYLPELESLRGLAIALVVTFHADGMLLMPFRNRDQSLAFPPLSFVWAGHSGVTLFFVLSAFLLTLPFLDQAYGGRPVRWGTFWERRALRILPLYFFAVLAGAAVTAQKPSDLLRAIPYLAFLESVPRWVTPMPPFSTVWWSLATEMQFYAVLPLVALAFGLSTRRTWAVVIAACIAYVAVAGGWVWPWLNPWVRAQSLIGRAPVFAFGIAGAWLYHQHGVALRARLASSAVMRRGGADLLLLLVLIALGLLLRWSAYWGFMLLETTYWFTWHVPEGALWTIIVLIVLLCPLGTKRVLCNPLMARLGILSYSIYMLHVPVLHYGLQAFRRVTASTETGWVSSTTAWFAAAALLLVGLSMLTYRFIERPFLIRKASLGGTGGPATARAA